MKAFKELGLKKILKVLWWTIYELIFSLLVFSPLKVFWLRLFGAAIGRDVILDRVFLVNLHNNGIRNLKIDNSCFLGRNVLLDLAGPITLGEKVTIAFGAMLITHINVGYQDHFLQKYFPREINGIKIGNNSFIGAGTIILPKVKIGEKSFVGAGSLVNKNLPCKVVAAGDPIRIIKKLP